MYTIYFLENKSKTGLIRPNFASLIEIVLILFHSIRELLKKRLSTSGILYKLRFLKVVENNCNLIVYFDILGLQLNDRDIIIAMKSLLCYLRISEQTEQHWYIHWSGEVLYIGVSISEHGIIATS